MPQYPKGILAGALEQTERANRKSTVHLWLATKSQIFADNLAVLCSIMTKSLNHHLRDWPKHFRLDRSSKWICTISQRHYWPRSPGS